jgi:hypothetical protein
VTIQINRFKYRTAGYVQRSNKFIGWGYLLAFRRSGLRAPEDSLYLGQEHILAIRCAYVAVCTAVQAVFNLLNGWVTADNHYWFGTNPWIPADCFSYYYAIYTRQLMFDHKQVGLFFLSMIQSCLSIPGEVYLMTC